MNKLDLHGVRHHKVQQVVDQFLSKHLYNSTNEVSIIIGNSDKMKKIVDNVLKDYNLKYPEFFQPLRLALTGSIKAPSVYDMMIILGFKESIKRVQVAIKNRFL